MAEVSELGPFPGMSGGPVAVPLIEQLRSIPIDAKLRIDTPNALGCMDTRSIPVGRLCHEAAAAIARTSIGDTPAPQSTEGGKVSCAGQFCDCGAGCLKPADGVVVGGEAQGEMR